MVWDRTTWNLYQSDWKVESEAFIMIHGIQEYLYRLIFKNAVCTLDNIYFFDMIWSYVALDNFNSIFLYSVYRVQKYNYLYNKRRLHRLKKEMLVWNWQKTCDLIRNCLIKLFVHIVPLCMLPVCVYNTCQYK